MPYAAPAAKKANDAAYARSHRADKNAANARYCAAHPDAAAASQAKWHAANPGLASKRTIAWKRNNPERANAWSRSHRAANPELSRARVIEYRADKDQRTVDWDTELTDLVTKEAADLARLREIHTGIKWHIDHVVPLRGRSVSGLHVWNNLAVIPAATNLSKSNSYAV